jgi:hypothetical protein
VQAVLLRTPSVREQGQAHSAHLPPLSGPLQRAPRLVVASVRGKQPRLSEAHHAQPRPSEHQPRRSEAAGGDMHPPPPPTSVLAERHT